MAPDPEELLGYQRLAWFATPAETGGLWVLALALLVNSVRGMIGEFRQVLAKNPRP